MGRFRRVEKVNAHIRAIYVGESAFSDVVARLKAAKWEDRWFKGLPVQDTNVSLAGGSYSDVIADVAGVPDKMVDVWIEAHYDQAISVMYYRIVVTGSDEGLPNQIRGRRRHRAARSRSSRP